MSVEISIKGVEEKGEIDCETFTIHSRDKYFTSFGDFIHHIDPFPMKKKTIEFTFHDVTISYETVMKGIQKSDIGIKKIQKMYQIVMGKILLGSPEIGRIIKFPVLVNGKKVYGCCYLHKVYVSVDYSGWDKLNLINLPHVVKGEKKWIPLSRL